MKAFHHICVIAGHFVFAAAIAVAGCLFGATVTYTGVDGGEWSASANWDSGTVPTSADDVEISGATVVAATQSINVNSLTLDGATLSVGGKQTRNDVTLSVAGDLVVKGGSKLTVYAGTLAD